jgi:hypothetical protein
LPNITPACASEDGRSRPLLPISHHGIENDLNGNFVADAGIHHQVETVPRGPIDFEMLFDEVRPVAVRGDSRP